MICYRRIFLFLAVILGFINPLLAMHNVVISAYEKERDEQVVKEILDNNAHYLRYEDYGLPCGTTEGFINSPSYTTCVIRENDRTVGFINYKKIEKKLLFLNFGTVGHIHLLGVTKESQGKGYGKQLIVYAIRDLLDQGVSSLFLLTKIDNLKARTLYEQLGFTLQMKYGEDCFYVVSYANPRAPEPTMEEKVLAYSVAHPGKSLLAGVISSYLLYKSLKWVIAGLPKMHW